MTKHAELIARLEAAEVGSRELDYVVENALGQARFIEPEKYDPGSMDHVRVHRPVTTSLDAALALASRLRVHGDRLLFEVLEAGEFKSGSPALAICIAILKALDAQ